MILFAPILLPLGAALVLLLLSKYLPQAGKFLAFAGTSLALLCLITLCNFLFSPIAHSLFEGIVPDTFALLIAVCISFFALLAALFSIKFNYDKWFYFNLLISTAFAIGAVLSDNFLLLLFFWEGLLISLYLFIAPYNSKTAAKAFLINAAGDVVLLAGVCLLYGQTGSLTFTDAMMPNLDGNNIWPFIFLFTGTVAKAGAFPFQTWIGLAAKDMPSTFMALLPAAIEKLLAVFLIGKLLTVIFPILNTQAIIFVLAIGIVTVVISAVKMLAFKSLKELLALSIILQIGLLILGLAVREMADPQADLLFIANHGIFKAALLACAFFAAGNIELRRGSTMLSDLKGTAKHMALTKWALIICMLGLAGASFVDIFVLPNTLMADIWQAFPFLIILPLGSMFITLFTFTKVLKAMGGTVEHALNAKSTLANFVLGCALFVVLFFSLGFELTTYGRILPHFAGFNFNFISITVLSVLVIGIIFGINLKKPSYIIKTNTFDIAKNTLIVLAGLLFKIDRGMDIILDRLPSATVKKTANYISQKHTGSMPKYMMWAIMGIVAFILLVYFGGTR